MFFSSYRLPPLDLPENAKVRCYKKGILAYKKTSKSEKRIYGTSGKKKNNVSLNILPLCADLLFDGYMWLSKRGLWGCSESWYLAKEVFTPRAIPRIRVHFGKHIIRPPERFTNIFENQILEPIALLWDRYQWSHLLVAKQSKSKKDSISWLHYTGGWHILGCSKISVCWGLISRWTFRK